MATRFAGQGDYLRDTGSQKWINVFGDVEVIRNLGRLKTSIERKVLRKAIAKGLKPIAAAAKRKAAVRSGLLKRSIKSKVTRMVSGKIFVDPKVTGVVDGKLSKPAKYAHLIEFGTRKAKAQPFMRPAMNEGRTRALAIIEQTAREELKKL